MQKTILYAVLNWGLGHATRSIPIIQYLIQENYKLIIVSDGAALTLLQNEFPGQTFESTQSYGVVYGTTSKDFNLTLAGQIPKFISVIKKEHQQCISLCQHYQVDYIISDNRYGYYHEKIPSAFLCHQLHLRYPDSKIIEKMVNKTYQAYQQKFSKLWVPDLSPPANISAAMSNLNWKNVNYLGIDSRFEKIDRANKYDYLAILSGPEPQRSLLEAELLSKLNEMSGNFALVRGTTSNRTIHAETHVQVFDLLTSSELNQLICASKTIICRSGYTSILDLMKLDKNAILIPTPGQAEQIYLADNLAKLNYFHITHQGNIQLSSSTTLQRPQLQFGYNVALIQDFLSC